MNLKKIIREEFVKPLVKVVVNQSDEFKTEFVIDGEKYWFQARDENKIYPEFIRYGWHLGFGRGSGEDKYLPTNKGKQFEVFSAVKYSLDKFIKEVNPNKMSFIAEGESKANIYVKLVSDYGYTMSKGDSGLDSLTGKPPILFKLDKSIKEEVNDFDWVSDTPIFPKTQ